MRPKMLKKVLEFCIKNRIPVMLTGRPGIGKTDLGHQVTNALRYNMLVGHPVVQDPTDYKGLPAIVNGAAEFLPYGDLQAILNADKPTVMLFDDLGQAPPAVQAAVMQLVLARQINGKKISDNVTFVACTNGREHNAGVTTILEPLKGRFAIYQLTPHIDDWCEWAIEHDIPAEVIAWAKYTPQVIMQPPETNQKITNTANPRTVARMGIMLREGIFSALPQNMNAEERMTAQTEALAGAVGEGAAAQFIGFLRYYESLPDINTIIKNPDTAPLPGEMASVCAVTVALATIATVDNAEAIIKYLSRLPDEYSMFGMLMLIRACPKIQKLHAPAMLKWAMQHPELI